MKPFWESRAQMLIVPLASAPLLAAPLLPVSPPPPPHAVATRVRLATAAAAPRTRLLMLGLPPGTVVAASRTDHLDGWKYSEKHFRRTLSLWEAAGQGTRRVGPLSPRVVSRLPSRAAAEGRAA